MDRNLKVLAICESIDLKDGKGMTPFFWQIFKSLSELGVNTFVAPVKGRSVDSLWWRCYDNPTPSSLIYGSIQSVYSGISRPLGLDLIRYTQVRNVHNNSWCQKMSFIPAENLAVFPSSTTQVYNPSFACESPISYPRAKSGSD